MPDARACYCAPVDAATVDARPSLDWRAPAECIRATELSRAVTAELGAPAFAPGGQSDTVVYGRVVRTANGFYRVDVSLQRVAGGVLGVRTLEGDNRDCRSLDEATAVMLAIMLNVSREEIAAAETPRSSYEAGLALSGVVGLLPRLGADITAFVGPTLPGTLGFAAELDFAMAPRAARAEGFVRAWAATGRAAVSPVLVSGPRVEFALRFAAGAGVLSATGDGFPRVASARRAILDMRVGARVGLLLGESFWLGGGGDVGVLPIRPTYLVQNQDGSLDRLFRPSLLLGTFGVTFSFRPP
jgi:hypothetical protein